MITSSIGNHGRAWGGKNTETNLSLSDSGFGGKLLVSHLPGGCRTKRSLVVSHEESGPQKKFANKFFWGEQKNIIGDKKKILEPKKTFLGAKKKILGSKIFFGSIKETVGQK
jgi:hypothetical protein